jgi:hypothetical protein
MPGYRPGAVRRPMIGFQRGRIAGANDPPGVFSRRQAI